MGNNASFSGVFKNSEAQSWSAWGTNSGKVGTIKFNASTYSSIYKDDGTVKPASCSCLYYIKW